MVHGHGIILDTDAESEWGFWTLPLEIQQQILDRLDRKSHKVFCLVSWRAWHLAIGYIWRDVRLIDCRKQHYMSEAYVQAGPWMVHPNITPTVPEPLEGLDEHDDTPIVRKLLVLARSVLLIHNLVVDMDDGQLDFQTASLEFYLECCVIWGSNLYSTRKIKHYESDQDGIPNEKFKAFSNKTIASKVVTLTHKCHLPPPSIFTELPKISYNGQTLSSDWRTLELTRWAVWNMENVQTLRIISGHYNLTTVLLAEFFHRTRQPSIKHLWLESCSYAGFPINASGGLESVRLRRLHMVDTIPEYTLSRCGTERFLPNGIGGLYETTVNLYPADLSFRVPCSVSKEQLEEINGRSHLFLNDQVYKNVPEADAYYKQRSVDEDYNPWNVAEGFAFKPTKILNPSSNVLKSLTLDWVSLAGMNLELDQACAYETFASLSRLTFPSLRAFQLRNAATVSTRLPHGIYLLEPTVAVHIHDTEFIDLLQFMERHSKLKCLAWPMDRFYSNRRVSDDIRMRARVVVENLGRTLVSLRVDSYYMNRGEAQTDRHWETEDKAICAQRRLFISSFAAHMTNLKHLKIEGGIPRDEKREIIRAIHACPLEKLVMIGTNFSIGNTWGRDGEDLIAIDEGHLQFSGILESEDEDAILASTMSNFPELPTDHKFHAQYGWPASPPLVHTIAMYHASTITELKFCGYNGSPVLHKPLPITTGLLHHLRHFHNLRTLIMSFWLMTFFDHDWREAEIIDYWLNQQHSTSTALATVPAPPSPVVPENGGNATLQLYENLDVEQIDTIGFLEIMAQDDIANDHEMPDANPTTDLPTMTTEDPAGEQDALQNPAPNNMAAVPFINPNLEVLNELGNPWEIALLSQYSPRALANGVYQMLSPHLSPQARSRKHNDTGKTGVNIRASFMLGVESGDIFDLEMQVDSLGVVERDLRGPREEADRYWEKLESRLWF